MGVPDLEFTFAVVLKPPWLQEKAIVLKAMRPGAPQPPAAAAQPCAAAQGSAQTTAHPPASTQRILPPVTVGATEASRPTTGVPNVPASLLGTSFSAPWVQRDVTSHYAEGRVMAHSLERLGRFPVRSGRVGMGFALIFCRVWSISMDRLERSIFHDPF